MSPHLYGIQTTLMELFTHNATTYFGKEYPGKRLQKAIIRPNLNLIGATTPDAYFDALTPDSVKGGFIPRTIF